MYLYMYIIELLHEGKFHVGDLCEPAIFDSFPWAYVMCNWAQILLHRTQVSPAFFKISDLAPDRGMLQSELFTSRSQNLVLAKLRNSGFWRYGQFFK